MKVEKHEETNLLKSKASMISEERRWMLCEDPKVEKHIEAEMIRYFELTLY